MVSCLDGKGAGWREPQGGGGGTCSKHDREVRGILGG